MLSSKGFTLIEILIALSIISIGIGLAYSHISDVKTSARLERTIKEAKLILTYAEMIRQRSGGLTVGVSPAIYVHSRPIVPTLMNLDDIEVILNFDTGLSRVNAWGNEYQIQINTHYSRLTTLVGAQTTPIEAQSATPAGTNTLLSFVYNGSPQNRLLRGGADSFKRHYYLEDIR
jgi:prepilin-type N-terminal cleavage/methylation domain-containing protein